MLWQSLLKPCPKQMTFLPVTQSHQVLWQVQASHAQMPINIWIVRLFVLLQQTSTYNLASNVGLLKGLLCWPCFCKYACPHDSSISFWKLATDSVIWHIIFLSLGIWIHTLMHVQCRALSLRSCATLETPWSVARLAPASMGFPRQEHWSGLPCPPPGDLLDPGIEPTSPETPALQADSSTCWAI